MNPALRIGQIVRTLRPLLPRQIVAQLRHAVRGVAAPARLSVEAPELAVTATAVPFLAAPAHARIDPGPRITLIGRSVDTRFGIDWDLAEEGPLFAYHLHQFEYLRGEAVDPALRNELMLDWIRRHPHGIGWDPHPISLRILAWGKLLLTPGALPEDAAAQSAIRHSLASQVETLLRGLEVRLQGNHLLSNLIGVVFGALLLRGSDADRWLGLHERLGREIELQILPDGLHEERSPMYHALLLENLMDLLNLARASGPRAPAELIRSLENAITRMRRALALLCHPDGEIALFSDSAFGIAQAPERLDAYADSLGFEAIAVGSSDLLPQSGYLRLAAGPFTLIASVAGPAPPHQPGHAHCDALSFELSCGNQRVVTDTGVSEYTPGEPRRIARATASHSTLEVDGAEQAEIWAAHRVGGRPQVAVEAVQPGVRCVASCRSWSTRDTLHRRVFQARDRAIEIRDLLVGRRRPVRLLLPLAPGLEPRLAHDRDGGAEAHIPLPGGGRLRVALPVAADWRIERTPYFPEFGRVVSRACLVGVSNEFDTGTWRFEWVE